MSNQESNGHCYNEKEKFIGGAQTARNDACKRKLLALSNGRTLSKRPKGIKISVPGSLNAGNGGKTASKARQKSRDPNVTLARSMKPSERFFSSLLTIKCTELAQSNKCEDLRIQVLREACTRTGLPLPAMLPASFKDGYEYYSMMAALVMEEARYILSDALFSLLDKQKTRKNHRSAPPHHHPQYFDRCQSQNLTISQRGSAAGNGGAPSILEVHLVSIEDSKKSQYKLLTFQKAVNRTESIVRYRGNVRNKEPQSPQFTTIELSYLKPGCVVEIIFPNQLMKRKDESESGFVAFDIVKKRPTTPETSVLACVVPMPNFGDSIETTLKFMMFRSGALIGVNFDLEPTECKTDEAIWIVRPVASLIRELRQFEACTRALNVPFLPKILGWKEGNHVRFDDQGDDIVVIDRQQDVIVLDSDYDDDVIVLDSDYDDDVVVIDSNQDDNVVVDEKKTNTIGYVNDNGMEPATNAAREKTSIVSTSAFALPILNATQEKAASSFLSSPSSTLTLIQGPPGTGKTTLMVSVICKSMFKTKNGLNSSRVEVDSNKRICVTAPTNKAITVLASRFMEALQGNDPFNVVMIGVEEKLLSYRNELPIENSDLFSVASLPSSLRSIFVYTWVESIAENYSLLERLLQRKPNYDIESVENALNRATKLKQKLKRSLFKQANTCGAMTMAIQLATTLEMASDNWQKPRFETFLSDARQTIKTLLKSLGTINSALATKELLATANVIFCTLSTAGVSAMKATRKIDDLFVDEAAAASEPEVCIPFHLNPSRMLAVGDPMQLPATIMSRHAVQMGFDKSLYERLVHDCGMKHIMLDVQYRMRPEISYFPSKEFYDRKLLNGSNVIRSDYRGKAQIMDGRPYTFIPCSGLETQAFGGSYCNNAEAQIVLDVVKMVWTASSRKVPWDLPDQIRIITFYQGQVLAIRRLLSQNGLGRVLVATVDSSQGCEADIVIVSFVRSNGNLGNLRRAAGFLTDDRRMNVALTRARYQLICIGDAFGTLETSGAKTLKAIVDDAKARKVCQLLTTV